MMKSIRLRAFSLLEMAIVLLIIAAVIGGSISMFAGSLQKKQYEETAAKMDVIEKALLDFRRVNDRLPCPGSLTMAITNVNFGIEAAKSSETSTSCHGLTPSATYYLGAPIEVGLLPTKTLKLPDDYAFDSWGRRIMYVVDGNATVTDAFAELDGQDPTFIVDGDTTMRIDIMPTAGGGSIGASSAGPGASGTVISWPYTGNAPPILVSDTATRITVVDENNVTIKTSAIYALISGGKDGHGMYSTDGATRVVTGNTNTNVLKNCDCTSAGAASNTTYFRTLVQSKDTVDSTDAKNAFNQVVRTRGRQELRRVGE